MLTQVKKHRKTKRKTAGAFVFALASVLALAACSGGTGGDTISQTSSSSGEDLVISLEDITDQASFYPTEVNGTAMEVIAVKAPDGTIRTAFNTCQVCYDSGRGYYEQSGDKLVCQNCGNQFTMDRVEVEAGGCNPWPIMDENKTVTEDSIIISSDFLNESAQIFKNWKVEY